MLSIHPQLHNLAVFTAGHESWQYCFPDLLLTRILLQ